MMIFKEYPNFPPLPNAVYPGHALVVALYIMRAFESASKALAPTPHSFPACVGSGEVPGAGDGAYAGASLIRKLQIAKGGVPASDQMDLGDVNPPTLTVDECIEWAQKEWKRRVGPGSGNHEDKFHTGEEQAKELESMFRERIERWDWT